MAVETPAATPDNSAPTTEATAPVEAAITQGTAEGQTPAVQETKPPEERLSIMGVEIEKSKVPPELLEKVDNWNKSYTEKSQALSAAEKEAKILGQLKQNPAFQKWYWDQVRGPQPETPKSDPYDLTPERQAELLSDPSKFKDYIKGMATAVMNEVAIPAAQQAQYQAQVLRSERETEALIARHPDAQDLINNEKIQEVIVKYPTLNFEDAYWLAKRDYTESEAELKGQQRVQEKVNGSVIPPSGAPPVEKIKTIPGKGLPFDERVKIALEHSLRNEKIRFDS